MPFSSKNLGQHIQQVLMDHQGLSLREAAKRLRLTSPFLLSLIDGKTTLSTDMALRLSRLLETHTQCWPYA